MNPNWKIGNTRTKRHAVLLIEDEPAVMALVRAVLEGHGYTVVPTESGAEALRLLEAGDFHGVVSDMRTPGGVDGAQVYAWIASIGPTRLAPGFYHRRHRQRGNLATLRRTGVPCVEKPFRVHDFISVVERPWARPPMNRI